MNLGPLACCSDHPRIQGFVYVEEDTMTETKAGQRTCSNGHPIQSGWVSCPQCGESLPAQTDSERIAALEARVSEMENLLSDIAEAKQTPSTKDDKSAWRHLGRWLLNH